VDALVGFYEILRDQPVLTLFLILALGYLGGRARIGSFSFGPVTGVLFAGLFFGHQGFRMAAGAQSLGFALFIFSVGYQAGPRFFDVLRTDGLKYFALAMVVAATGFGVAVVATVLLQLEPGASAGLLSGGMTSSPTLAAAQEAVRTGSVAPPTGWTPDAMIGNIATAYAITYIFGLAGLIMLIKLLPRLLTWRSAATGSATRPSRSRRSRSCASATGIASLWYGSGARAACSSPIPTTTCSSGTRC